MDLLAKTPEFPERVYNRKLVFLLDRDGKD